MSVWSQYRFYFAWPTEVLLVGPNNSKAKWTAWAVSFVVGFSLGLVWCHGIGMAVFTAREHESLASLIPLLTAAFLLPMVVIALVLPRIGGPLLTLTSLVSIGCLFPLTEFDFSAVLRAAFAVYIPMLLVGLGFMWSGLRPEVRK